MKPAPSWGMKHSVSLPAFVARAAHEQSLNQDDPRKVHPPLFVSTMVLSPLVWPVGVMMGIVYLCAPKWRGAGAVMLAMGLLSGLVATAVYLSLR